MGRRLGVVVARRGSVRLLFALTLSLSLAVPHAAMAAPRAPERLDAEVVDGSTDEGAPQVTPQAAVGIDRTSRSAVRAAYRDRLLPALQTPVGWTGSVEGCVVGSESAASRAATVDAVNYYRAMVDLPPVVEEPAWSAKALEAALMMRAADSLSHHPDASWRCHTTHGAEAAARSNLHLRSGAVAVRDYIIDPGPDNGSVGHRRWVLYPQLDRVGTGSADQSNALWVVPDTWLGPTPPGVSWIAWPPSGYVPWEVASLEDARRELFRWSLSSHAMPDVDHSNTSVDAVLAADGSTETLVVSIEARDDEPPDDTLVWSARRPGDAPFSDVSDAEVTVTVSGIRNAGQNVAPHTYTVRLFQAVPAVPEEPTDVAATGGFRSATITWKAPAHDGGAPVTGYRITRHPGGASTTVGNVTSATVTGLTNGTPYWFRVAATNEAGVGRSSGWSNSVTPRASSTAPKPDPVPSKVPSWGGSARLGFDVEGGGVRVSWPRASGEVSDYEVLLDGRQVATTTSRSRVVSGLQAGQRHRIEVRARNGRGSSAALVLRVSGAPTFRDVSSSGRFAADVRWLATGEVTLGCNPPANDRFCPRDRVTRQQMAAFIVRALGLEATSGARFRDVPRGSTFERDIDRLATAGITLGCNPPANDRYCPTDGVTREQMAAFLRRGLAG